MKKSETEEQKAEKQRLMKREMNRYVSEQMQALDIHFKESDLLTLGFEFAKTLIPFCQERVLKRKIV